MAYVPLEQLMKNARSLYKLVLSAAERANEIAQGAPPLVKTDSKKATTVALDEFAEGKVRYVDLSREEKTREGAKASEDSGEES